MIEYYRGFKITAQRGHIMVDDPDGNFFQSADTLAEAITDIDDAITYDDLKEVSTAGYYKSLWRGVNYRC